MPHVITPTRPFALAQTLAFLRRFPPCQGDFVVDDDQLAGVFAAGDRAAAFTLLARGDRLIVETDAPEAVRRVADLIGAHDDVAGFYAAAAGDAAFAPVIDALRGLHHVRFRSLEEIAVYSVLMQRTPVALASRFKQRFLAAFGLPATVAGRELRAMPSFDALVALPAGVIADAIGHRRKAAQIAAVVRGVAALGEDFLRDAPYAAARDALLAIPGIGPFSAGAILLRGLGRMDELPVATRFADEARAIYGAAFELDATVARYGRHIGYWSYYLKAGAPRLGARASSRALRIEPDRSTSGRVRASRATVRA